MCPALHPTRRFTRLRTTSSDGVPSTPIFANPTRMSTRSWIASSRVIEQRRPYSARSVRRRNTPREPRNQGLVKTEQLTEACATHGEGPIWDEAAGVLRWVDMLNGDVLTMTSTGTIERLHVAKVAAAIRPRAQGGLVVAVERGFLLIGVDGEIGPEHPAFTDSGCRMNDGGVDRQGRFFCGSMAHDMVEPCGALYRFGSAGEIATVLEAVTISNGMPWSAGGAGMVFLDSATQRGDPLDLHPAERMPRDRPPPVQVSPGTGPPDRIATRAASSLAMPVFPR